MTFALLLAPVLAQMSAKPMGKIVGGWEYIWAAYLLTWVGLVAYGVSLWIRRKASNDSHQP